MAAYICVEKRVNHKWKKKYRGLTATPSGIYIHEQNICIYFNFFFFFLSSEVYFPNKRVNFIFFISPQTEFIYFADLNY